MRRPRPFGRKAEEEVKDELQFHFDQRVEELVEQGMDPEAARRMVSEAFGNRREVERECVALTQARRRREERRLLFSSWRLDLRAAGRTLVREPGYSWLVIVTLAVAVGAAAAVSSAVQSLLLQPLPMDRHREVVVVWQADRLTGTQREPSSVPDYLDLQERTRTLSGVAAWSASDANLLPPRGEAMHVEVASATANYEVILGPRVVAGRFFTDSEARPGGPAVVVLGERFWRRAFGSDPNIVGQSVSIEGDPHLVVGVSRSSLARPLRQPDIWLPLQEDASTSPRWSHSTWVIARLKEGVALAEARAELGQIGTDLEREYPRENAGRGFMVEPVDEVVRGDLKQPLRFLALAVLILLATACVNIANLTMARSSSRRHELAVTAALGAGRFGVFRRFFIEALLLASIASLVAIGMTHLLLRGFGALAPDLLEVSGGQLSEPRLSAFLPALGVGFALMVLCAALPAVRYEPGSLAGVLRSGQRRAGSARSGLRTRRLLVAAQVAMALVLATSAALLGSSLANVAGVDAGFSADSVLRASFRLPSSRYPSDFSNYPNWQEIERFDRRLVAGAEALPSVVSAALTTDHPLAPGFTNSFVIVGREAEAAEQGEISVRLVSREYFETNRLRRADGRLFSERDAVDRPAVAVVNQAAIDRFFPGGAALGQRLAFWGVEREIVGVIVNEKIHGLESATPPAVYVPLAQAPHRGAATLMVRTDGDPRAIVPALESVVRELDPAIALYDIGTMSETVDASLAKRRFVVLLLGAFAAIAVLLSLLGVYGLLSYSIAQERHEIGVRMALGARRQQVLGQFLRSGLVLTLAGVAVGTAASLVTSRLLAGLLFGVRPHEPMILASVVLGIVLLAMVASLVPALRATRVAPVEALSGP